jgi:hypothetical protein
VKTDWSESRGSLFRAKSFGSTLEEGRSRDERPWTGIPREELEGGELRLDTRRGTLEGGKAADRIRGDDRGGGLSGPNSREAARRKFTGSSFEDEAREGGPSGPNSNAEFEQARLASRSSRGQNFEDEGKKHWSTVERKSESWSL